MSHVGVRSAVYFGEDCLGELEAVRAQDAEFQFPDNEIRIHHISPNSERCHPLAVLQTISYASVRCKLEPSSSDASSEDVNEPSPLINLHASCFYELKTAVVLLGTEEIHLVAMPSKQKRFPCFWCYSVPLGLYDPCLWMLNKRCLAIVFDLDETLIVANTMKSFENRIEVLVDWIARESDPVRESCMTAEMKRYVEDRSLLKQYAETDCVVDGGKVYNVQQEEVPLPFDGTPRVVRPVVRLPEKNIVLTRIKPENRDTSVLVRLRPAWEDLKNYLTAKGRKRFEVYVCTLAERDYALEMWRLLDPESNLINSRQLLDRVVCVKSGARKSLLDVFKDGICHPKMAMVIDDRLNVWEDKDQPRVHVVPAFAPYFAPQAESANAVPVLTVARNVACNVRGGFFRDFDENLLHRISDIFYEDETVNLPSSPDVSNYLMPEEVVPNGYPNAPIPEGITGPEVAQRLNSQEEKNGVEAVSHPLEKSLELKPESHKHPVGSLTSFSPPLLRGAASTSEKPSLLGNPFRRDSQNSSFTQPPLLPVLPLKAPTLQWFGNQNATTVNGSSSSAVVGASHESQAKNQEATERHEVQRQSNLQPNTSTEFQVPQNGSASTNKERRTENERTNLLPSLSIPVLQEIGRRCRSKVEFRPVINTSDDLQFSVEVFFTGEKIGIGMGKTRKDAQQQAAENALRSLADNYASFVATQHTASGNNSDLPLDKENGFLWDDTVKPESEDYKASNGFPKPNA